MHENDDLPQDSSDSVADSNENGNILQDSAEADGIENDEQDQVRDLLNGYHMFVCSCSFFRC